MRRALRSNIIDSRRVDAVAVLRHGAVAVGGTPLQGFVPLRGAVPFQKLNVDAFAWYGARASAIAGGAGGNTVTGRWVPFTSHCAQNLDL
jgi:hypothetical protein